MNEPEWLHGLTHMDFLIDGSRCSAEQWAQLDWSKAVLDLGPYWRVPDIDGECSHRLYPRLMQTRWAVLVHHAITQAFVKAAPELLEVLSDLHSNCVAADCYMRAAEFMIAKAKVAK